MEKSITILRKFKKHEREALLPLYQKHVNEYLIRIVAANVDKVHVLMDKINTFYEVATCHEVAFNAIFGLTLATHQNALGFEKEYSQHPKAKNVSRNRRVRLIWALLYEAIVSNPSMNGIKPLDADGDLTICPICGAAFFERQIVGFHDDGTADFQYIWNDVHSDHAIEWIEDDSRMYFLDIAEEGDDVYSIVIPHDISVEDWTDVQEVYVDEIDATITVGDLDSYYAKFHDFESIHPEDCKICFDEE